LAADGRSCVPDQPAAHAPPACKAATGSNAACQHKAALRRARWHAARSQSIARAARCELATDSGVPVEGNAAPSPPCCAHAIASAASGEPLLTSPCGAPDTVVERASQPAAAVPPELGSADPHGLQLDDDRAASCSRQPAFNVRAHSAAGRDELCGRTLPRLNQAKATAPKPPPAAPAQPSPRFSRVEQVVPRRTLGVVRLWMKRLRRCLRAAERGAVKLARRLRPADLWLAADEHTMPAARGLVVDLRPLASGGDNLALNALCQQRQTNFPTRHSTRKFETEWNA
jgi:hypothetical protein